MFVGNVEQPRSKWRRRRDEMIHKKMTAEAERTAELKSAPRSKSGQEVENALLLLPSVVTLKLGQVRI